MKSMMKSEPKLSTKCRRERLRKLALETIDLSKDTTQHTKHIRRYRNFKYLNKGSKYVQICPNPDSKALRALCHILPLDDKSMWQYVVCTVLKTLETKSRLRYTSYTRLSAKLEGRLKTRSGLFL